MDEAGLTQRRSALVTANERRFAMAQLKRELGDGTISALDAIFDVRASPLRVDALLRSQPRWGTVKTRRVMARAGLPASVKVRELTAAQVARLAKELQALTSTRPRGDSLLRAASGR